MHLHVVQVKLQEDGSTAKNWTFPSADKTRSVEVLCQYSGSIEERSGSNDRYFDTVVARRSGNLPCDR